jgi:5-methylcytosine-specific restriction endonuclease McrA
MRIEIGIFLITALLIANLYTEGKYLKLIFKYKKYVQIIGIAVGGLIFYYLIKKNPLSMGSMLTTTNEYLKYMPLDKNTTSILNPILDFTSKQNFYQDQYANSNSGVPILPVQRMNLSSNERKIMTSGENPSGSQGQKVKRSVSETKKKFVASRQGWKCGDCQDQLNAWFEVDHKIRLEHGGSNHVDNLVALCRDCHGKKTTIENL